ncbi:MAG: trehalose-phosphatase [Methanobacteriaceae archaeon]|nr:trehalose-phosphatase [Methanobacteriaceae archaeon]
MVADMPEYLFDNLRYLEAFKQDSSTGIVTDIDGTISKIAPTPDEAVVTSTMRRALVQLNEKFKLVAVISGRSVLKAREMVQVDGLLYVGNHGLEFLKDDELCIRPEVEKYIPEINEAGEKLKNSELSSINGLIFEDKGLCYSIHYRLAQGEQNIREKILNSLKDDPVCKELKISEGRCLFELKPPVSYDKGTILHEIIEEHGLEKIIYLGDDITDFDAFSKLKELEKQGIIQGVGILVLSPEIPSYLKKGASFFINNVDEVLKFFQWLLN